MPYDLKTVFDVSKAIKLKPGDLKVLTHEHSAGLYYQINDIRTCYVLPTKDWGDGDCFYEVDKDTEGAIQIVLID
jgi:hypothetical protein